jgi:hypothetical protein
VDPERQRLRAVAAGQFSVAKPVCRISGAPHRLTARRLLSLSGVLTGGFFATLRDSGRSLVALGYGTPDGRLLLSRERRSVMMARVICCLAFLAVSASAKVYGAETHDDLMRSYMKTEANYRTCLERQVRATPILRDGRILMQRTFQACEGFDIRYWRLRGQLLRLGPVEFGPSPALLVPEIARAIVQCRLEKKPERICGS